MMGGLEADVLRRIGNETRGDGRHFLDLASSLDKSKLKVKS